MENQSYHVQKKKKSHDIDLGVVPRNHCMGESKMPVNFNGRVAKQDMMYTHALHGGPKGINTQGNEAANPSCSYSEKHRLQDAKAIQSACMDKWREYQEHHNWQNQRHYAERQFDLKQNFDYHPGMYPKEGMGCRNARKTVLPHPATLTSQVNHYHSYYHYNAKKHEDACRLRDVKESCLPAI